MALAAHAAEVGADAVVVIGPPYFRLDERAQHAHFLAAALACAPLPFYVYEFESTSGYAVAPAVLERLRDDAPNLAGLKVSDTPFERFSRYLLPNLDIFVGPEALIHEGLAAGAVGAVSALASAFPRDVAAVVRDPTPEGAARLAELRAFVERFPRQAALKRLLGRQGVPVREDVRAPLRGLTTEGARRARRLARRASAVVGAGMPGPYRSSSSNSSATSGSRPISSRACVTAAGSSSPNTTTPKRSLA